jgi:multiple sugar transport system ATP-binding protein
MTMADRIVVMHDGRVEQIGTPLDLYDNPVNLFVAGFIGSPAMNFVKGTMRRDGGQAWVDIADGVKLPAPGNRGGRDGQSVVYGVRPEHLAMASNGARGMRATVEVVEPTGADTFVYATVAGTQICAVFTERYDFRAGAEIELQPQLDVIHLFDAASGRKLD